MAVVAAEDDIKQYLRVIDDPAVARDEAAIAELDERLSNSHLDPAARLDLLLRRRQLESVNLKPFEDAFVRAVPAYLEKFGLEFQQARKDFADVGVKDAVLDRVALSLVSGGEGERVSSAIVRQAVLARTTTFTQSEISDVTGASRNTVGKVVAELVDEGRIVDHGGRPKVYLPVA